MDNQANQTINQANNQLNTQTNNTNLNSQQMSQTNNTNINNQQVVQDNNSNMTVQPTTQTIDSNTVNVQTQQPTNDSTAMNNNLQYQQLNSIPNVNQSKEQFINNAQAASNVNKENKKSGINYAFLIILFLAIIAAIYFLFPYLFHKI